MHIFVECLHASRNMAALWLLDWFSKITTLDHWPLTPCRRQQERGLKIQEHGGLQLLSRSVDKCESEACRVLEEQFLLLFPRRGISCFFYNSVWRTFQEWKNDWRIFKNQALREHGSNPAKAKLWIAMNSNLTICRCYYSVRTTKGRVKRQERKLRTF